MRAASSSNRVRGLFPQAVVATTGVVVLPVLIALAMVIAGLPEPEVAVATFVGLALACCAAAVGSALWLRKTESVDVAFGELMLWRWARRKRAEEKIEATAEVLIHPVDHTLTDEERLEMLHELAVALEVKDPYTHGHSRRVERHAYRTAMALGLSSQDIEDLRTAASLHDVGKIDIPDAILRKPGPLTEAEQEVIKAHPEIGAELVRPAVPQTVTEAILHHHERWDGHGYPSGLAGSDIPLAARIIAVADAYDAITSARPYKTGSARRDAVAVLERGSGVQFDAEVVAAFISTLPSAVPALAGLLLLAWPAQVLRKSAVWAKSVGAGSIATAATSAGMAALVGTAGIGVVQQRAPMGEPNWPSTAVYETYVTGGEIVTGPAEAEAEAPSRKKVRKDRTISETASSDGGGSSEPAAAHAPVSASEVAEEPVTEPPPEVAEEEGKYEPFEDPQPDNGKECEKGKGQGLEDHCS